MTPERWQEVKDVLAAALERTPEGRRVYLDDACTDPALRREVESLIVAHEQGGSEFLQVPAAQSGDAFRMKSGSMLGHYEILARIGVGGMGEVYEARDTKLGRRVAIKVLPAAFVHDTERLSRFQREARMLASLNHPNIATIHGLEQSGGVHYLVMELVPGQTLAERITHGALPLEEALKLASQIAEALEAAHEKGILHRDLKPSNILVTEKGAAKLLDFGLAKLLNTASEDATLTLEGTVSGTPAYMSPEQARGESLDARSDVFGFGAVLYEMFSGKRAFGRDSVAQSLSAVLRDEPSPLEAPAEIDLIVRKCLAKQPLDRFPSMRAVKAALEEVSTKPTQHQPSIAVLSFANMSGDKENEYFSDGLAEEILNLLAKIQGLKVIARTSAFAFKGQNTDIRQIAKTLGVANIVEGSVRKAGNRIRVTAQLIAASDGSHLWSERYDRELADVFAVQDEIAAAIAGALQVKLSAATRKHTPKLAAYEEFLKARHHLQKWAPGSVVRAKECLERATAIDPGFAQAHSELGWCFFTLVTENQILPREAADLMRTEARKALEIDPSLADAEAVLGMAGVLDYDWTEAGRHFRLAMAREPIQSLVRYFYGHYFLAPLGRMKEAEEEIERGLQEDPLNLLLRSVAGIYHIVAGRVSEGQAILRQLLELDDTFWIAYVWLLCACAMEGRIDEAIAYAEKIRALAPWNPAQIGMLAGLLERKGEKNRAQALLKELGDGTAFGAPAGFYTYHAVLGQIDLVCDWLEKAIDQRDARATWILPHFFGNLITSSPRWPKLAKMMNLPERVS
jgi:eukaryotic-like serine/threonine-protein kinase